MNEEDHLKQILEYLPQGLDIIKKVFSVGDTFHSFWNKVRQRKVKKLFDQAEPHMEKIRNALEGEEFQSYFLAVIDQVANEANEKKIEHWKNALVHLATDFKDFEFKDNYLRTLGQLTVLDLMVLHKIYSAVDYDGTIAALEKRVIDPLVEKSVPRELIDQPRNGD